MDCVKAQQLIRPYLEGILSDRELEEFLGHVENCPSCFGELEVYFSIYRTLNNTDEKGDYNYEKKLQLKLRHSKNYLRSRQRNRVMKVGVILAAELTVAGSFYTLFRMPGGYISRHRREMIPVVESEAGTFTQGGTAAGMSQGDGQGDGQSPGVWQGASSEGQEGPGESETSVLIQLKRK